MTSEPPPVDGLTLVVPARDEETRLPLTLAAAARELPTLARRAEILVVDDGSRDATARVASEFESPVPVRVVRLPENRGKGAAVHAGIEAATQPYVAFTDADCPYDLGALRPMLAALAERRADVAIGARDLVESGVSRGYGALRRFSGQALSLLTAAVLGLPFRDSQCGLKCFRAETARALFAVRTIDRFGFDFEILAAALDNGLVVERFPVELSHHDESRVDVLRDGGEMFRQLWQVRRRLRRGGYRLRDGGGSRGA
ncbi:glycosyltransferase [bacterium]|nr:glycosyltransferase [bacterium]